MDMLTDAERLKRMVENDAGGAVKDALRVVESDIMALLSEFMDVSRLDMCVVKGDGCYKLTVTADVDKFYEVGMLSDRE